MLQMAATIGGVRHDRGRIEAAGLDPALEHRSLELKGKESPTEVVVLRV